jgi:hypothetical protein
MRIPASIPTNTKDASKKLLASETRSITSVIMPGPAVKGKANGIIAISSCFSEEYSSFLGLSILSATLTRRMPPAILNAATVKLKTMKRRCPVKAKNAKTRKDILIDFSIILRFFLGLRL